MTQLREQKSILAKLMATEDITVRHAKVPTAGFDPVIDKKIEKRKLKRKR